ncbi:hypothetical protein [Bacillus cereus group sp. BfR-BA-01380]|uniref:hypothetical protein n=1 Tax=Bacillus cereus group sp. BfR-BA-01380 TaxID=2920324 RepID=UPI001F5953EB|nr:hypothetical protein [Bacillus cereus group sp. BfR-BA-01380]
MQNFKTKKGSKACKTLIKQRVIQDQQEQEEAMRHAAPPAPPAVPVEVIEEV